MGAEKIYLYITEDTTVFELYLLFEWIKTNYVNQKAVLIVPNKKYKKYAEFVWPADSILTKKQAKPKQSKGVVLRLKNNKLKDAIWDTEKKELMVYLNGDVKNPQDLVSLEQVNLGVVRFTHNTKDQANKNANELVLDPSQLLKNFIGKLKPWLPLVKIYYGRSLRLSEISDLLQWMFYKRYYQNIQWQSSESVKDSFVAFLTMFLQKRPLSVSVKKQNLYYVISKDTPKFKENHKVLVEWQWKEGIEMIVEDQNPQPTEKSNASKQEVQASNSFDQVEYATGSYAQEFTTTQDASDDAKDSVESDSLEVNLDSYTEVLEGLDQSVSKENNNLLQSDDKRNIQEKVQETIQEQEEAKDTDNAVEDSKQEEVDPISELLKSV